MDQTELTEFIKDVKLASNIRGDARNSEIEFHTNAKVSEFSDIGICKREPEDDDYQAYVDLIAMYIKPKVLDTYNLAQNVIDERERIKNKFRFKDGLRRQERDQV